MGSLGGHALPGSFFIIIGLWHLVQLCVTYFRSRRRCGPPFKSATYYTSACCPKLPVESLVKLISTTIGLIIEVITAFKEDHFVHIGNGQHICMYAFFGMTAFIEILEFYRFALPSGIVYACYALSFLVEALLFYWHLHVQAPLEVQVHTLLIYVSVVTIFCILVEMKYRRHVLAAMLRTFFIIFHGVWFWQVAFILYPPHGWEAWDWKSHEQMMIVTIIFCADMFVTLFFCLTCWFIVACRYGLLRRELAESKNGYKAAPQADTTSLGNGQCERFSFKDEDEEDALISE